MPECEVIWVLEKPLSFIEIGLSESQRGRLRQGFAWQSQRVGLRSARPPWPETR